VPRIAADPLLSPVAGIDVNSRAALTRVAPRWGSLRRVRLDGVVEGVDRVLRVFGDSPLSGCLEELHAQKCWVRPHWNNLVEDAAPEAPLLPPCADVLPRLLLALLQLRRVRALSLRLIDPDDRVATAKVAPQELEDMAAPLRWREEWQCRGEEQLDQAQGDEGTAVGGPPVVRVTLAFHTHGVQPAFARALMARHPGLVLALS
jgi:hypothetical protein